MYIYQSDNFCDDCGKRIMADLDKLGQTPPNVKDERSYDSDKFPKYCGPDDDHGESDSPCHCGKHEKCLNAEEIRGFGKVGKLLGTNLTDAGVLYVIDAIGAVGAERNLVTRYWARKFGPLYAEIQTVVFFVFGVDFYRSKK